MERFILPNTSNNPNFIGSWIIKPPSLFDSLINYFELNRRKQIKGASKSIGTFDIETKDSLDISITPNEVRNMNDKVFKQYFEKLFHCHNDYILQWPFLENFCDKYEIGSFNLQKYNPGQHFKKIHTERSGIESLHRVFVFMTYLNDVSEGGETYFSHYDLAVKPQKGLTLIWPAEWTHAHRGNILKGGTKYIITGWINFCI